MGNFRNNSQKMIKPTHCLNLCCFHIVSASDYIQTLNKTEDSELFILYSLFCYLWPFSRYYNFSFMVFLFLFRFYNGCVMRNLQQVRVGDVITTVKEQWNVIQKSQKQLPINPTTLAKPHIKNQKTVGIFVTVLVI